MRYKIPSIGLDIGSNEPFRDAQGNSYPANWTSIVGPEDLAAIGMVGYEPETQPQQQPQIPASAVIDGVEFLARVADDEYAAILSAALTSVQIARWLDVFRLRGEIDVTGTTSLAAKNGLVAMGILTLERANEIFSAA